MLQEVAGKELVQAIVMLFIIMDPLGNAPLFYAYTVRLDSDLRKRIIVRSVLIATLLLLFFGAFGEPFLSSFGVTLSDFRVAGGVILFIYGVLGILGKGEIERMGEPEALAAVPLATPLLAGPGAIATVIFITYNWGLETTLVAIAINAILSLTLLIMGESLLRLFGKSFSLLLTRLLSMLLAAIAISMIRQGIMEIV
uniref:UPF0056 membrane protein n=1 Tax=Fervidicoccus fontis TaxID=683846 RepID=A0A7J3ZJZ0_9CREN